MTRKRRPTPAPVSLTKEELRKLFCHAMEVDYPIYVLMLIQYWHAGRNSEMINLTTKNFSDGFIHYERKKGSESCTQRLVAHTDPVLNEESVVGAYLKTQKEKRLYPRSRWTYWRHLVRLALAVGIPRHKANTRVLKHSICTHLLEELPMNAVQRRAGHVNGANTLRYAKLREDQVDELVGELCTA